MGDSCGCCVCVSTGEVAVVETLGKYSYNLNPGPHWICIPIRNVAGTMSLRVQQLSVPTDTKTKDDVTIGVTVAVQYQVNAESAEKIEQAYYRLTDPRQQITSYVDDVVRSTIPKMTLNESFENKDQVAKDVKENLASAMEQFGYTIIEALVVDLDPSSKVKSAMNEINAARRNRQAAAEVAEAQKILAVKSAEGEAEAKYLSGVGVARQRHAIVTGLKDSVLQFAGNVSGTSASDVINMMMTVQYMDMLRDSGANPQGHTMFLNHSPGAVSDLQAQVRDGFVQSAKASKMSR